MASSINIVSDYYNNTLCRLVMRIAVVTYLLQLSLQSNILLFKKANKRGTQVNTEQIDSFALFVCQTADNCKNSH